ncbi:MAG: cell division protein FtsA [Fusobacteriota bacterium]
MNNKEIVVAIDIGTTKIHTIVAEVFPESNEFQVIGKGISISEGLNKGVIVDVEKAAKNIEASVRAAEYSIGFDIQKAYIGVAGKHIESMVTNSAVSLGEHPREIVEADKERLGEIAISKVVPIDRKVIHKILYNYRIDDSGIVKNPIGMKGKRLTADAHIVTGVLNAIDALVKSVNKISIEAEDVLLEPLASAKAVLNDSEKKLGVALVDIGGGTTDVAIFKHNKLIYTSVLPVGGEHYTQDIAALLNVELKTADRLKKEFSLYRDEIDLDDIIEIPSYSEGETKKVKMIHLKEIIDSRTEDILEHVQQKIEGSGYKHLIPNGIVFTGGASKIAGLKDMAEDFIKDIPVRLGKPKRYPGILNEMNKPENSTGIGLLLHGVENYSKDSKKESFSEKKERTKEEKQWYETIRNQMKEWFEILF